VSVSSPISPVVDHLARHDGWTGRYLVPSEASVPSTAGRITSFSSRGTLLGNGEATCQTYAHPSTASAQPASLVRSASANSSTLPERSASAWTFRECGGRGRCGRV
jgi:hypothetical protein